VTDAEAALHGYDLQARSAGALADAAFGLLRSDPLSVGLFVVLPWLATRAAYVTIPIPRSILSGIVSSTVAFCVTSVGSFALQTLWAGRLLGRRPSAGAAAVDALKRAPAVILATVASGTLFYAGAALLAVPGFYVMLALLLPSPVLVFEPVGAFRSLARSRSLMVGAKRRLFLPVVLPLLVVSAIGVVSLPHPATWARTVLSSLVAGFLSALAFVAYVDVRCRKEGFDVYILAARVEAGTHRGAIK
jgi:hypothetical protein